MISAKGSGFDVILVTGECYDDHPLSPSGVIARVIEAKGFSVGIIEKPSSREDFTRLGDPKLCFCVTSGSIDSMLNNYTPLKKKRVTDKYSRTAAMPDRAVIVYCNRIREYFRGARIVIGGVEASLRRFAHYDYWDNAVRRSILADSRADILVYGNGEKQIAEILERLADGKELDGIRGTCVMKKTADGFHILPSSEDVRDDRIKFCSMQKALSNQEDLAQGHGDNFVVQYSSPQYASEDLDWVYSLPFTRKLHPGSLLAMARFSVVTHRGCIGRCSFCSIALHQGDKIISRSEESILQEITALAKHPDFKGYIDDLGGPSANMYGMDCDVKCRGRCMGCKRLDTSHKRIISLMRKARQIPGVKKVFVRSGVRYDLAVNSAEYIRELSEHHISGCLKIAPEHFSRKVLMLMNKDNDKFEPFLRAFSSANKTRKQYLKFYLMVGHPGDSIAEVMHLKSRVRNLENIDSVQLFTPTPMTDSTCMYWTGLNPYTLEKVDVTYDYGTKKKLKNMLFPKD